MGLLIVATGGVGAASAAGSGQDLVGNLIKPCRLVDTRPAPDNIGPRNTPIGAGQTFTAQVTGTNGNCVVPSGATGIIANVTVVGPTAQSNLTVWPADQARPLTSNLNWVAGQPPVPNQVTTQLSAAGTVSIYNNSGSVNVIVDVVGYFTNQDLSNYYTKAETAAAIATATADPCKSDPYYGINWAGCNEAGRDLSYKEMRTGNYTGTNFAGANLSNTLLNGGQSYAQQLAARGSNFGGANLTNASVRNANFVGANLSGANLTGADFSYSDLGRTNLTGVVWSSTRCPDGSFSNTNGTNPASCIGHL